MSGTCAQVDGPTKVNVHAVLEGLRRSGSLMLVGAEAPVMEGKTPHFRKSCVPARRLDAACELARSCS